MRTNALESEQLARLRKLDSCSVANAIEAFDVRMRNRGFTDFSVHCIFDDFPPMVGYAATVRVRTAEPPMEGHRYYYRLDWLDHVLSVPEPRVVVLQDMDEPPGLGACIGDVHANVLLALGCVGVVTNGAVRNVDEIKGLEFQMFAKNLSVSHAYAHVFDFGTNVEVGGMDVRPGDLIFGDRHGVQTVPNEIAHKIPALVEERRQQEQEIIELCRSADFNLAKLRAAVNALGEKRKEIKR